MQTLRRCVISGVGLATPAGSDLGTFWQTLSKGKPLFESLAPVAGCKRPERVARVQEKGLDHGLNERQLRKLDRFTVLALAATRGALADGAYQIDADNRERLGLLVGNCTGGWSYVEPMMYGLHTEGMEAINPYVATAWFPAAPQGEISILHGMSGYSKTVAADRLSCGYALELSLWLIRSNRVDAVLVGGAESPLSPLVLNSFYQSGQLSEQAHYRPFSPEADGFLLGEGAAMVIVEDHEQAQKQDRTIYAEVLAVTKSNRLDQGMRRALEMAGIRADAVDYILLDASGNPAEDAAEYEAIASVFAKRTNLRMSAPKSMYGNTIGANTALDLSIACLSLQRQVILPTAVGDTPLLPPPIGIHVTTSPEAFPLRYILINSRDSDGQSLVILLGHPTHGEENR
jgi:3-oxoacyl-[acyl-carrier-protein] synthase II